MSGELLPPINLDEISLDDAGKGADPAAFDANQKEIERLKMHVDLDDAGKGAPHYAVAPNVSLEASPFTTLEGDNDRVNQDIAAPDTVVTSFELDPDMPPRHLQAPDTSTPNQTPDSLADPNHGEASSVAHLLGH